jgi:hypothetical protein
LPVNAEVEPGVEITEGGSELVLGLSAGLAIEAPALAALQADPGLPETV